MSRDVAERTLADLAEQQWQDYKTRFQPLEKLYTAELVADKPGERVKAISASAAEGQGGAAGAADAMRKGMGAAGLTPSSTRSIAAMNSMYNDMGAATGGAASGADLAIGDKRARGILQAVAQGRGIQQDSIANQTSSAISQAQNQYLYDKTKGAISSSNWGLLGNLAGMGMGYASYKMGGAPGGGTTYSPPRTQAQSSYLLRTGQFG